MRNDTQSKAFSRASRSSRCSPCAIRTGPVIPKKLREELRRDPYYRHCALEGLHGHECAGRVTWEHALTFEGKKVQMRFCLVPLCEKAHAVCRFQDAGTLRKDMNVWVALNRASEEEIDALSKAVDYIRKREYLNEKYGPYTEPTYPALPEIDY